jgi:hypothetical protein
LATWLWLVEFSSTDTALDASGESTGELATSFRSHFGAVHVLRDDATALERVQLDCAGDGWEPTSCRLGSPKSSPWPARSFDCIALHDALARRNPTSAEMLDELTRLHTMLRSGGWLALASRTLPPVRRGRPDAAISRRVVTRQLRLAGFGEIRCLFGGPTIEGPLTLLPNSSKAVGAFEASDAMRGAPGLRGRRTLARLGARDLLYPAYLLLARA